MMVRLEMVAVKMAGKVKRKVRVEHLQQHPASVAKGRGRRQQVLQDEARAHQQQQQLLPLHHPPQPGLVRSVRCATRFGARERVARFTLV